MKELSKNNQLRITRIGLGLSQEAVAKKLILSPSYIHLMEKDKRPVPKEMEDVLDFSKGIKWYLMIVKALSSNLVDEEDALEALNILNNVIGI